LGIAKSLLASAGVGVSGIHDDRARKFFARMLPANFYRRGANLVRRKHSRYRRRSIRNNQSEITLLSFLGAFASAELFDVAENRGAFETAGRAN